MKRRDDLPDGIDCTPNGDPNYPSSFGDGIEYINGADDDWDAELGAPRARAVVDTLAQQAELNRKSGRPLPPKLYKPQRKGTLQPSKT